MNWHGKYIGIPFGDGPGQLTCWGLVRRVYTDMLGIDLPAYGEVSARDLAAIARTMGNVKDDGWRAIEKPEPFDVALMRSGRGGQLVVHVGVVVDSRIMHVEESTATAIVPMTHFSVAGRIMGFRRLTR